MNTLKIYDVAIIGGGLAGLSSAILFARKGHSVILVEKEKYPFHKVCGEYISMESWDHLCSLGLDLEGMNLPQIRKLMITAPNGKSFHAQLPLGGFGLSRYHLDKRLSEIALEQGVHLLEETRADAVEYDGNFKIFTSSSAGQASYTARICIGSFGKRSNLDIKWKRTFLNAQDKRLQNFVGVKYHIRSDWPDDTIGLHNFEDGYCGISRIEDGTSCLCYMTSARNLKNSGGNIRTMEENILFKNPHLRRIFNESERMDNFPLTISQISFSRKSHVEDHALMIGDAGGMITPLCGNGMSIALHTGKIAAELGINFLEGKISREELEKAYISRWEKNFSSRLKTGRLLQGFFGSPVLSNGFIGLFRTLPFLAAPVIRLTHGKPF
jgi:menaquinone-9 beta-reductase